MKLLYAMNIRIPTEKAHGTQIFKTCEAFAENGAEVELCVTNRSTPISEDPFSYYGIARTFALHRLWSSDTVGLGPLGFAAADWSFALSVITYLRGRSFDVLYSRDENVLWLTSIFGHKNIVWESHIGTWNLFSRSVAKRCRAIIVISQGLKDFYIERGVPQEKIHVAHDGVDLKDFKAPQSQTESRKRLGLPQEKKIAMYIGRLDGWKGSDTFCAASEYLPDDTITAVIGGEPKQIEEFSRKYPKVIFLGARPYRELADNQSAADVLVLPNTGKDEISARFTSPLKLFTYMASGRPIVASDLPSIREILSEKNAVLVESDDPREIAKGIVWCLEHDEAKVFAQESHKDVVRYSWDARAQGILAFLNSA
jgi:glycosyltransferase involved in cell wall biosynthesis